MAHFYLVEHLESAAPGDRVSVTGAEARHAVTVSRIGVGEELTIGNGAGLVVTGSVVSAEHAELVLEVGSVLEHPRRDPALFLVQALAKADRDELAVQAATELGVDGVVPWQAARSISRWEGSKVAKGRDRWAAIVREASKQSLRPWIPDVLDLVSTKQLASLASGARMLVLEPTALQPLTALEPDGRDLLVVVGPEGGVSPQELEQLVAAGAEPVRLGPEVLRTSTAGPAAIAVLNGVLGRW
ncbi:16S rRNA (uracil(1498)-N(3))-methyltransferase [Antiquaquibacter soli]|uniref:Ribosomal RNA small subunit methyltransferase E n=1 Tax=Antiquaquibacter soli TaxID=3064523 RepID=A0ABT9BME4_9MICO|nr:16S rRNA (uracil(1498)-N(3))-methyltransferase [Protaetiibacter sp. WY-16]MDO7882193.1 16S rRNA (uracil(1498)-N(3))-methyltransferase [Protaetiibacter sp. WY-16]